MKFYTNDSESNKFQIKQWLSIRGKKLPVFIKGMSNLVRAQYADHKKAYCNIKGKYFVHEEFADQLKSKDFFRMTANQRQSFLTKIDSFTMSEILSKSVMPNIVKSVTQQNVVTQNGRQQKVTFFAQFAKCR